MRDTMKIVNQKIEYYTAIKRNLIEELGNRASQEAIDRLDRIIDDFKELKKIYLSEVNN